METQRKGYKMNFLPYVSSNLSAAETYKLHDSLSREQVETLLQNELQIAAVREVYPCLQEGMATGIQEDFLRESHKSHKKFCQRIKELQVLQKHLRGGNRQDLEGIIESLIKDTKNLLDIEQKVVQRLEHQREE